MCRRNAVYGVCRRSFQPCQFHNDGRGARYTACRRPVTLVYSESFDSKSAALKREFQLKRWARTKKDALIAGNLALLKRA